MNYRIEIYEDLKDYELVDSYFDIETLDEALDIVKKANDEGLSAMLLSDKSGYEAFCFADGDMQIDCGEDFEKVKDKPMEEWF